MKSEAVIREEIFSLAYWGKGFIFDVAGLNPIDRVWYLNRVGKELMREAKRARKGW